MEGADEWFVSSDGELQENASDAESPTGGGTCRAHLNVVDIDSHPTGVSDQG